MSYRHGVYIDEVPTSILPPVRTNAGLPVVFGTAPVNLTDNPSANVNKPVLCTTYAEAVAAFGFQPANTSGKFEYSISEFMSSHFSLFAVAPVVFVNVLDPASATHITEVTAEARTLVNDQAALVNTGVLKSTVVVKSGDGTTTYALGDDYEISFNSAGLLVINKVTGGAIADNALQVDYDHLNPAGVVAADVIGGVDGVTGALTGLELINEVFPRFRVVPGLIVAPGHSTDSGVAAVMAAKASSINGNFKAMALVDISTSTVTNYADVAAEKNTNNITSPYQMVGWPMVSLGGNKYHLSTQLAGLICRTDAENGDIPYTSPSNKNLQADSAVLTDGTEVFMDQVAANLLNGQGIATALNFIGGWKAWGNRTAAYPASTDVKDTFIPVRRMFNFIGNTLTLTFWQRLDFPLNRRQIDTVVDSANVYLNGLTAQGYLLGGRVEFLQDENPTTDLIDGIARFHVYLTPPSPNREIDFILEYDATYLETLFG